VQGSRLLNAERSKNMTYPWFALQVRSRYEKIIASHLDVKGYEWFSPMSKVRRQWSDRVKEFETPLFPGYLFCRLDPANQMPVLTVPGVMVVVGSGKTPTPVDESEIMAVQAAVRSGLPTQPLPFLKVGQRVRVNDGPLCGVEGILTGIRNRSYLVLSITTLGRSVAVQVETASVRAIPTGSPHPARSNQEAMSWSQAQPG